MNQITETDEKKATSEGVSEMEKSLDMLKSKVEELSVSLMDKATELETLHTVASEQEKAHEAEVSSLKAQIEELKGALEVATKAKEEAVSELNQIREDALLEKRVTELKDENLFRSGEEARIKQVEKIKGMTDEEFATYKDDLIDIRNQALGTSAKVEETKEEKTEEVKDAAELISEKAPIATQDKIRQLLAKVAGETATESKAADVQEEKKEEESSEALKESASCNKLDPAALATGFTRMLNIEL